MTNNIEYAPFPAADYIRDMRAAGGSFKLRSYGHDLIDGGGAFKAREAYFDRMRADPDHLNKTTAELEAESALQKADPTVFSDDQLAAIEQIVSDANDLIFEEIDVLSIWPRSMRQEMAVLRAAVEGLQRGRPAA